MKGITKIDVYAIYGHQFIPIHMLIHVIASIGQEAWVGTNGMSMYMYHNGAYRFWLEILPPLHEHYCLDQTTDPEELLPQQRYGTCLQQTHSDQHYTSNMTSYILNACRLLLLQLSTWFMGIKCLPAGLLSRHGTYRDSLWPLSGRSTPYWRPPSWCNSRQPGLERG